MGEQTARHPAEQQGLTADRQQLERNFQEQRDQGAATSGGDLEAAWEEADSGEKTVGGSTPTPDHDSVDRLGEAVGIPVEDTEETMDLLDIFRTHAPGSEEALPEDEDEEELEEEEEEEEEEVGEEEERA